MCEAWPQPVRIKSIRIVAGGCATTTAVSTTSAFGDEALGGTSGMGPPDRQRSWSRPPPCGVERAASRLAGGIAAHRRGGGLPEAATVELEVVGAGLRAMQGGVRPSPKVSGARCVPRCITARAARWHVSLCRSEYPAYSRTSIVTLALASGHLALWATICVMPGPTASQHVVES